MQDEAVAGLDRRRALLLGGLTASDTSTGAILLAAGRSSRPLGQLPTAVHDTAAVRLGKDVYVFGGGTGLGQLDSIVRIDPSSGATAIVGHLPAPSSDQAAAGVGGTAYVIGGYTGSRWLDTIVAWRPGAAARVVAHLPSPVRYAAVTAVDGEVIVAGGSLPDGSASRAVLAFRPTSGRVVPLGELPAPTTHGAAATLGHVAYLVGGRGTNTNTPTARIVAIDPSRNLVRVAGRLSAPRSDLAAVSLGDRIVLAGGRGPAWHRVGAERAHERDDQADSHATSRRTGLQPRRLRPRRLEHAHRRSSLRAIPDLRPEQPERNGGRDRPPHLQSGRTLRRRCASRSTSCPAGT